MTESNVRLGNYLGGPLTAALKIIEDMTSGDYGFTGSENADLIDDVHELAVLARKESPFSLVIFDYSGHKFWGQNWHTVLIDLQEGDISRYAIKDIWGYTIVHVKEKS